MGAVKTSLKVEDITQEVLRKQILRGVRKRVPIGMGRHQAAQDEALMPQGHDIESMTVVKRQYQAALKQIGSLGGGNHFIELQRDEDGYLWVMLHSGSRNFGKQVCDYYNEKAGELNRRWHSAVDPAMMLSFLPLHAPEFDRYWAEMQYCTRVCPCQPSLDDGTDQRGYIRCFSRYPVRKDDQHRSQLCRI